MAEPLKHPECPNCNHEIEENARRNELLEYLWKCLMDRRTPFQASEPNYTLGQLRVKHVPTDQDYEINVLKGR